MITPEEKKQFLELGYLHVPGALAGERLALIQSEFDRVWDLPGRSNQTKLLGHKAFIDLIEHPAILDRHKAIFGAQAQLLQYDLLRQGPRNESFPLRSWHRDFVFPGDQPLSVNTILFLDPIREETGPTRVIPHSHRGAAKPEGEQIGSPHPEEVAVYAEPGDAIFINSAIWHTGGRNTGEGLRRGIYLYYGYWWLKRYESDAALPWQALEGADEQRLQLLGVKMPAGDIHQY
jgi:ectoine hydroxylase-related dioxygenase (phytanoyl-CoA dioxygenase family)